MIKSTGAAKLCVYLTQGLYGVKRSSPLINTNMAAEPSTAPACVTTP